MTLLEIYTQLQTTYIELLFVPTEKSAFICTHRKKLGSRATPHLSIIDVPIQFKNVSHI
jgi:hypothetical protein